MTEPRFRIRASSGGWPAQWLAFSPRRAVMLTDDPARAYVASRASIDAIMRSRGGVFGHCDLAVEPVEPPPLRLRAYREEYRAGRTRKLYFATERCDKRFGSAYEFNAHVAPRAELEALLRVHWADALDGVMFEEVA